MLRECNEKIVFYRCKKANNGDIVPFNYNIANSLMGFLEMGINTKGYFRVDEIYNDFQFGDILLDGIDQVEYVLKKFDIVLEDENYPEILQPYMGRKVWKDTINNINTHPELWGNFVKPIKDKRFTGHIINSPKDLIGCGSVYENYEVLVSEPVEFVYECRGFVYYDEMIDLRPYKGDYTYMQYIDTNVIKQAMEDWKKWEDRPMVCSLDWGIIREKAKINKEFKTNYTMSSNFYGEKTKNKYYNEKFNKIVEEGYVYKTVFIEKNSFSATACYGLYSIDYAKMVNAYFARAYNIEDDCHFGKSFK